MKTYTTEEIINDYRNVEDDTKKEIAAKYGIESRKIAEIKMALADMANNIRRDRGTLTEEDVRIFNIRWNVPESPKKIREAMIKERTEFVEFYLAEKLKNTRRSMQRSFVTSVSVLQSIIAERHSSCDKILQSVISRLKAQTSDFRAFYVKNMLDHAKKQFDALKAKYQDVKTTADIVKVFGDLGWKEINKIHANIAKARYFTFDYNFDKFIEDQKNQAERSYNNAIELVAERIRTAGMDPDAIKVNSIDTDVKAFEMYVTDGQRTMHARSIFAAAYSSIVSPHFRFIITNV